VDGSVFLACDALAASELLPDENVGAFDQAARFRRALGEIQAQSDLNSPSNGNCTIVKDRNAPFSVRDIAAAKSVAFINTLLSSGWVVDALHPVHEVHPVSV
jgi:hypothetical protein